MKLIHLADVHLGAAPDRGRPWAKDRQDALRYTFQAVVQAAEDSQADLLLISGDLFHRPPLLKELKEVDAVFSTLSHTRVVMIAGNHDFLQPDSPLSRYQWKSDVTLLKEPTAVHFPELSTTVYGFSYDRREITEPLYNGLRPENREGFHILLAHGGDASHIPYDEKALARSGFDYVALGHIHIPKIGPGPLGNPGSLEPLDQTETGPHGFLAVTLTESGLSAELVPAARFSYERLTVSVTPETTQFSLEQEIQAAMAEARGRFETEPIFLLSLTGSRHAELVFDAEALLSLGSIAVVEDETVPDYDLTQLYADHKQDMLGMYISALKDETDPVSQKALYLGIRALLDTMTP